MAQASRDGNFVPTLLGVSSVDFTTPITVAVNPTTHRVLTDSSASVAAAITTNTFTATNNQTIFTATGTVSGTIYLSLNGAIQTPSSDYSVSSNTATLANGVPAGTIVLWCYATS